MHFGRPPITQQEKNLILHKLEPYLKAGLSVKKALVQAQVPNSTFYKLMAEDREFMENIRRFQQYLSIFLSNVLAQHLFDIALKQSRGEKLLWQDLKFLFWFSLNSNATKEEFGRRTNSQQNYDPELEIKRILDLIDSNTPEPQLPFL